MLWVNGADPDMPRDGHVFYHEHQFNAGQHVAHNEMLEECVKLGVDWHIRIDDDCWINTRTWLKQLLDIQDQLRKISGQHAVLGIDVIGLDNPPQPITRRTHGYELKRNAVVESMDILGGIFRMAPMSLMRYFRWDERQAMGFGDATQFQSYCESAGVPMFRARNIHCTHGGSTQNQNQRDRDWEYAHDMLQYVPLGL